MKDRSCSTNLDDNDNAVDFSYQEIQIAFDNTQNQSLLVGVSVLGTCWQVELKIGSIDDRG